MFKIFPDAHKKIAVEIHYNVLELYDIELDKKELVWGSVLPDVLPKYKLIRHYKEESIDFVINEILDIIYINRRIDFDDNVDPFTIKTLSRRIGVISHYLADYVCLPHYKRWTFQEDFLKHIKYETKLSEISSDHEFKKNKILTEDLDIIGKNKNEIKESIKDYINHIIEMEYSKEEGFENDLDFALSLGLKMTFFILDTIKIYSEIFHGKFILDL